MANIEDILSSVMNNEDLMKKIKDAIQSSDNNSSAIENVVSLISPTVQKKDDTNNDTNEIVDKEDNKNNSSSIVSSLSSIISKNSGLLLALKPYLNKERCQLIDGMIKLSQISNILNMI